MILFSLLLWASTVIGQNADESQRDEKPSRLEFQADSTRFKRSPVDESGIKWLLGNVKAWTQDRDSELQADVAYYNSSLGETRFYGSAAFRDSIRHLNADTLIYYDADRRVIAIGNVIVTELDRSFRSDRVNYQKDIRIVQAIGNVIIRDDSLKATITGNKAVFNDSTRYGLVVGEPVLVKEYSDGSIISITCRDTLEIVRTDNLVRLWNNVEVTKDSLKTISGRAVYDDSLEIITLIETPEVWHVMYDTQSDTLSVLRAESYVTGDTIMVYLKDRKVSGVNVVGNALSKTVWTDSTEALYARNILESAKMRLTMENDMISMVTAEGTASSYYFRNATMEENMFVNQATGDTLYFFYDSGKITQLRISGFGGVGAKGKYYEYEPFVDTAKADSVETELENE